MRTMARRFPNERTKLQDACMEWKRLGNAIINRRGRMGITTRTELAERTGLSRRILTDLELGHRESYDPATLARVEAVLEWAPGSMEAILQGGQATTATDFLLEAESVDPRSIERYGDDIGIMALIAGSGLDRVAAMRLVMKIRRRRAEQYDELRSEVRHWIEEAGGKLPDESRD